MRIGQYNSAHLPAKQNARAAGRERQQSRHNLLDSFHDCDRIDFKIASGQSNDRIGERLANDVSNSEVIEFEHSSFDKRRANIDTKKSHFDFAC